MSKETTKKPGKTQKALTYALLALLEHTPFSKITVNDICEEALTSRSSFYVHFQDKYDLLRFALFTLKGQLRAHYVEEDPKANITALLTTLKENKRILLNLLEDATNTELRSMMHTLLIEDFSELFAEAGGCREPFLPVEVAAVFFAGGIVGLLFWWVKNGFAQTPVEMAGYIFNMLMKQNKE